MYVQDLIQWAKNNSLTPDQRQAAIDAIKAILEARDMSTGGGSLPIGGFPIGTQEIDLPIDPDLLQPKYKTPDDLGNSDDTEFEINDPDHLLKPQGGNSKSNNDNQDSDGSSGSSDSQDGDKKQSQDSQNGQDGQNGQDSQQQGQANGSQQGQAQSNSGQSDSGKENDPNYKASSGSGKESEDEKSASKEKSSRGKASKDASSDDEADSEDGGDGFGVDDSDSDFEDDDSEGDGKGEDKEGSDDGKPWEGDPESEEDPDVDTDAFSGEDNRAITRRKKREIRVKRALDLANKEKQKAEAKGAEQSKIDALQRAMDALQKAQNTLVNDENSLNKINDLINDVLDKIEQLGGEGFTYSTDLETRINKIKDDASNPVLNKEIDIEDNLNNQKEKRGEILQARDEEKNKYGNISSFNTLETFKINFWRAIKDQVQEVEDDEDTYTRINKRADDDPVLLRPGSRNTTKWDDKVPSIDVYIDQSLSWSDADLKTGVKAVQVVKDFETKGEIKMQIFYFSNNVYTNAASARAEGGTSAWFKIMELIQARGTKNVVMITDSDMEGQAARSGKTTVIDGCVWWIWRNGLRGAHMVQKLRGRRGNTEYAFKGEHPY